MEENAEDEKTTGVSFTVKLDLRLKLDAARSKVKCLFP